MNFKKLKTGENDIGRRLDRVIRKILPETPLPVIYKYIRSGLIKLNGSKAKQDSHLEKNDEIWFADFIEINDKNNKENKELINTKIKIIDVFSNEFIRIVNKPYGISVQASKKDELSLDKIIQSEFLQTHKDNSLSFTPGPLHRLDKNTTGLITFSQNLQGAQWFADQMTSNNIKKTYLGVAEGKIEKEMEWIDVINSDSSNFSANEFKTVKIAECGKKAITYITPISHGKIKNTDITLCMFRIETGRKHQIRAQSSSHGFPLAGDEAYKSTIRLLPFTQRSFFLHAWKINFLRHYEIGIPEEITAEPDETFKKFIFNCSFILPDNFRWK